MSRDCVYIYVTFIILKQCVGADYYNMSKFITKCDLITKFSYNLEHFGLFLQRVVLFHNAAPHSTC